MSLHDFLWGKTLFLVMQVMVILFFVGLFSAMRAGIWLCVFSALLIVAADAVALGAEFWKKRRFYAQTEAVLASTEQKYLAGGLIQEPDFCEGRIFTEDLRQITKSMNDELAKYRMAQNEYREYVETWIHEIKLPISCIALQCENDDSTTTAAIRQELDRIDGYVEQALYYARSVHVEKDYRICELSLSKAVNSALREHSWTLIACETEVETEGLDRTVYADPKWLGFILGQLLSNSIKYRSGPLRLRFSVWEAQRTVFLEITDNGIGIPLEDLERVFEKGFTGENGRRFSKSTGIGLYLCRTLCEKMNLSIRLSCPTA